ncbi:MAG: hypothetical protein WBO54_06395 [Thermoanaerobaculia bacterium]
MVVHVDEEVLADTQAPGVSMLEDGTDVSAETSWRYLATRRRIDGQ